MHEDKYPSFTMQLKKFLADRSKGLGGATADGEQGSSGLTDFLKEEGPEGAAHIAQEGIPGWISWLRATALGGKTFKDRMAESRGQTISAKSKLKQRANLLKFLAATGLIGGTLGGIADEGSLRHNIGAGLASGVGSGLGFLGGATAAQALSRYLMRRKGLDTALMAGQMTYPLLALLGTGAGGYGAYLLARKLMDRKKDKEREDEEER